MVRELSEKILNLIKENDGLDKCEIFTKPSIDVQKVVDIILSECRCSITDMQGNYTRFGSSTDIRIIRNLIKIFISNLKEIPPEIVSMALMKEEVLGPYKRIEIEKSYNSENDMYEIEMETILPKEFHINIFEENADIKNEFIEKIIKPYVREIIFENPVLMNKCPIGAFIKKILTSAKEDEKQVEDLINILKKELTNTDEELIENIASYMYINIMNNKYFKQELINNAINATELQKLGKIYSGFNSLVESMALETLGMIQLRNFPYGEYIAIKSTYYTATAVLTAISSNFENLNEDQILNQIEKINKKFSILDKKKVSSDNLYRIKEMHNDKFGDPINAVHCTGIKSAMRNLCKMIKILLENKDNIGVDTYVKEVLRIHYRFLRINPFESATGRTSRALVNILLQSKGMVGIFKKEKRKEYVEAIREANNTIKENEAKYLKGLVENPMECLEFENEFLNKELPFLLVKY